MFIDIIKVKQHYFICNTPSITKWSSYSNSMFFSVDYWIFYSVSCPHLIQIQKIIFVIF